VNGSQSHSKGGNGSKRLGTTGLSFHWWQFLKEPDECLVIRYVEELNKTEIFCLYCDCCIENTMFLILIIYTQTVMLLGIVVILVKCEI